MDELLARWWWLVWGSTALLVVLQGPDSTSAPAAAGYVAAVAVFPFGARALSLHHGPPRTRVRSAVVRRATGGWTRWVLVAGYALAAAWVAARFPWSWLPPVASLAALVAVGVASRTLAWNDSRSEDARPHGPPEADVGR